MVSEAQCVGLESPLGMIKLTAARGEIVAVEWDAALPQCGGTADILLEATRQLTAYFEGRLRVFDLPMALGPSAFQARFQAALLAIPFGETRSYGQLGAETGVSAQAAGQACGANRLPILVPCHRVLGAGSLGGYSGVGGVETKVTLLRLEGAAGLLI